MMLQITQNKSIKDLQRDFNLVYPYLKIDFYKTHMPVPGIITKKNFNDSLSIKAAGLIKNGELDIYDAMTVEQLEMAFRDNFGLFVQVSRKCGILWLETIMTDKWTLKQQNDHGRELSELKK